MSNPANFAASGGSGSSGGGGSGNPESPGLGQVVGFVTEFNQNVQIFGQLLESLSALLLLATSNAAVDPDAVGDYYADESTYGDGAQAADQRLYYENREKGRQAAKAADPLYALENRMTALEGMLGVKTGKDGEGAAQANPFEMIEQKLEQLHEVIRAAQTETISMALRADQQVLISAVAQATHNAVAQAMAAIASAIANLRRDDPTDKRAEHNERPVKWQGGQ